MIEIVLPLEPTGNETFTGTAYRRLLGAASQHEPIKLYYVLFESGARTHWHTHTGPQVLVVTSGRCRYQREGEPPQEAAAGESVRFAPGIKHWHGATPHQSAEHVAINLESGETTWLSPVDDLEYAG